MHPSNTHVAWSVVYGNNPIFTGPCCKGLSFLQVVVEPHWKTDRRPGFPVFFFSLTHPCQRQDGYIADDIFNYIFFKENINIFIQIILRKFVSKGIIGYALYQAPVSMLANHHDSTWRPGSNHQSTIKFDLRSKWNGRRQFSFENRWTSL